MFEYFYNEILRRTIISFGTLFNGLTIKTTNADDDVVNITRVPFGLWSYSEVSCEIRTASRSE